ncbi:MAG: putative histidine kinase, hybrid, partial [Ramlibacter sp.]|nr:putative histidine kinase, hybrid [Ramlibacter sp.]
MTQPYLASSIPEPQLGEFYRLMTEEIGDVAVFFMDTAGVITTWNRAAEVVKGYTAQDAIGQHLALLYTIEDRERGWPQHNLQEAAKNGYYKEETWRRKKDGTLFWARICLTALKDRSGTLLGFSKITLDLTDHKLLESCVQEREQTRRVLRAANAGTWKWNPDRGEVSICENFLRLLGHPGPDTTLSFDQWLEYFHEDDRRDIVPRLDAARHGTPFEMEFRLRMKDGNYRWFFSRAEWYRELDAQPWKLNGVNVEIHSTKRAQEEVREAIQKLREADARKDEFLAMLAHELRNPLAPIRSAAEVMRRSEVEDQRVRRTSEVIARQCDHLTRLVDDLLDVSRVTRGLVHLHKAPHDIRHILTDAIEQVTPAMQAREHHLSVTQPPRAAVVFGDEKRLVQVVSNLLSNAAKYTPTGGHIKVTTELREGSLRLTVADDGIGMEAETVEHAFELFSQAKRTPDRAGGGLGLGLALVKSLVDLHGGEVSCASEGLGKGSTFTVVLPLVAVAGSEAAPPSRQEPRGEHKPLRVVVVDDNLEAAEMLAMLLEALGHDVTTQPAPQAALEHAGKDPADVYLLDIGLPEIDGYELARRLRAQPGTHDAVFIAITGYGQENDRAESMRAGF